MTLKEFQTEIIRISENEDCDIILSFEPGGNRFNICMQDLVTEDIYTTKWYANLVDCLDVLKNYINEKKIDNEKN